jgi:DNA-binding CsgD family transcriptional regulator
VDELPMLAEATGATPAGYGRLTDELAGAGVLGVDGDGRLTCPSPAVTARLVAGTGSAGVTARRRALAEVMLSHFGNGAGTEPADLADRVALAGTSLPPDIALARLLMTLAARPDVDPRRSATWLRAAWWHAREPGLRGRIAAPLLRRLVRAGLFQELAALVDTVLTARVPMTGPLRDDLAAAAMLAAIHTGAPVDAAVRDGLTAGGRAPAIELVDRWFAGARLAGTYLTNLRDAEASELPLVSTAELIEVARIATVGDNRTGDFATALEQVLGDRYHAGADSLPAQYRKVLQSFAHGDFPAALTAARAVERIGTTQTPIHQLTRIWVTEICTQTGDFPQARQWLAAVGKTADPALRAWAECALAAAEDEADDPHARGAFRAGWTAYAEIGSLSRIGAALLVPRLAGLAMHSGEFRRGQELLIDINRRHQQDRHPQLDEARLLTQALVRNDARAGEAAVEVARGRGNLLALLRACITAAQRSETPQPLFAEAYAIAHTLDADYLCARLTTLMRRHGVSTRRPRRVRVDLSPVELRIIEMICAGRTNREIARHERMSEKTIEDHVSRLFARTGCRTRVQLATASLTGRLGKVMDLAEHAG